MKIEPPASPRRDAGTCGNTAGAASAISTPPEMPAAKRHTKNQQKESGKAQARNDIPARIIMPRSAGVAPVRSAIGRADKAPAR